MENLDQYHDRNSFFHQLDARVKLVFVLVLIFSIVLTAPGRWIVFAIYLAVIAIPVLFSRLSLIYVLKRSLVVIPFVLVIAIFLPFFKPGEIVASFNLGSWQITLSNEGITALETILIKAWLSLISLIWLSSTTRITELLQSSKRLGFPRVLVMILSFMYRYIFVIVDEMMRMKHARDSRRAKSSSLRELRTAGHIIGTLFIRSYERSERVYAAMVARGYDGQNRTLDSLSLRRADLAAGVGFLLVLVPTGVLNVLGRI